MRGKQRWVVMATMATMALGAAPATAETIFGLTDSDKLVTFDSATPGTVSLARAITGLQAGETVKGIDFRPATLQLYALGSTGRLYTVNAATAAATQVGAPLTLSGTDFGIDFNPTVDRLRIISDTDQNLRVNPNSGALAATDTALTFQAGDPNAGDNPVATGAAYTKNAPASATYPAPPATTLFDIDTANDVLVSQSPPNDGKLNTIGALGVDAGSVAGFDVTTHSDLLIDTAYALLRPVGDAKPRLYTVSLATGAATLVGPTGGADPLKDVAVGPRAPAFAVLTSGTVQGLTSVRPDQIGTPAPPPVTISGLQVGERLLGIDRRPNGGALYGLSNQSRLYRLDLATGTATAVSGTPFTPPLTGTAAGIDFNPIPDRLRVVTNTRRNFRLNAGDGALVGSDTDLAYATGDANVAATPNVTAASYTNAVFPAPTSTTLFDLDTGVNALATQGNPDPNDGVLKTVGALGVDPTDVNGFDIAPRFNHQFAALQTAANGPSSLYAVNVASTAPVAPATIQAANGGAVLVGALGLPAGTVAEGLTVIADSLPSVTLPALPAPSPYYEIPTVTPEPSPTVTPVQRKRPGLSATVRPKRDRRKPFRFTTRGAVKRPSGVSKAAGCKGKVRITVKRKGKKKTLSSRLATVKGTCKFSSRVSFKNRRRFGKGRARRRGTLVFTIRFQGNARLTPRSIKRTARYGR